MINYVYTWNIYTCNTYKRYLGSNHTQKIMFTSILDPSLFSQLLFFAIRYLI